MHALGPGLSTRGPGSVMTSASRARSHGTMLTGPSDMLIPLARSVAVAVSNPKAGATRTFDSVLASFPRGSQFAIREMILDIMELEMRKEAMEERLEAVR